MPPTSKSPLSFGESAASLQTAGLKSFGSKNSRPNGRSPFYFSPLSNNFDFYGFGIDKVRNLGDNGSITVSSCHTSSPHHTFKQLCSSNLSYKTIDCNQLPKVTPKVDTKGTIKLLCGLSTSLSTNKWSFSTTNTSYFVVWFIFYEKSKWWHGSLKAKKIL